MQHRRISKINVNDDSNLLIKNELLNDNKNNHQLNKQNKQILLENDDAIFF